MPAKWSSVIGHNFFFVTSLADGDIYALLNHRDAAFVCVCAGPPGCCVQSSCRIFLSSLGI